MVVFKTKVPFFSRAESRSATALEARVSSENSGFIVRFVRSSHHVAWSISGSPAWSDHQGIVVFAITKRSFLRRVFWWAGGRKSFLTGRGQRSALDAVGPLHSASPSIIYQNPRGAQRRMLVSSRECI